MMNKNEILLFAPKTWLELNPALNQIPKGQQFLPSFGGDEPSEETI